MILDYINITKITLIKIYNLILMNLISEYSYEITEYTV